jgi:pyruvate dehydrogenase E1 component alpha subunit
MLGANGVVGGGYNIAVGAGLSITVKKSKQVAVCFFGDGASNRGTFHEGLNMASIWDLPVIFVNENNCYASTTPASGCVSIENVADRALGYQMPGIVADGNDVLEVYNAAAYAVERSRQGKGPSVLECKTYRIKGHFVGDPERYRQKDEVQKWQQENDPLKRFKDHLSASGKKWEKELESIEAEAQKEIDAAIEFAEQSDWPDPEEAMDDLFTFSPEIFPPEVK